MKNKLLLTTVLSLALWANSFAQCTFSSGSLTIANTAGCTSISITGSVILADDLSLGAIPITVTSTGTLDFKSKSITLASGPNAKLVIQSGGQLAATGNSTMLTIGGRSWKGNDAGAIVASGGVNQMGPLPIELIAFNGSTSATGNLLHWETAEEANFSHFDIERSTNGQTFTKISQSKAKGSNSEYGFLDANPAHNMYYRLKINDIDGSFDYSNVISVQTEGNRVVQVYPTMTHDVVTIATNEVESIAQVIVFDMFGKAVLVQNALETNRLDLSALSAGMYLVQWQIGGEMQSAKVVKK